METKKADKRLPLSDLEQTKKIADRSKELADFRAALQTYRRSKLGYWGIGGIGKSTLLREYSRLGKLITPYVVYIDLSQTGSRFALIAQIVQQLENGPTLRYFSFLSRVFPKFSRLLVTWFPKLGVFYLCKNLVQTGTRSSLTGAKIQSIIEAAQGAIFENVNQSIFIQGAEDRQIEQRKEALEQCTREFLNSIPELPIFVKSRRIKEQLQTVPVILIFDVLESVPLETQDWLESFINELDIPNVTLVFSGRDHSRLTDSQLSDFPSDIAYHYLAARNVRQDLYESIITLSKGNPLCLDLAAKYAQNNPKVTADDFSAFGSGERLLILEFLYKKYTHRLKLDCENEKNEHRRNQLWQLYYAFQYGLILRHFNADALKSVLSGLEFSQNVFRSDDDFMETWRELVQHSFVNLSHEGADFHLLIKRMGMKALHDASPDTYTRSHELAKLFCTAKGDELGTLYHSLCMEPETYFENLTLGFYKHCTLKEYEICNQLINIADEAVLPSGYDEEINLMKVDLRLANRGFDDLRREELASIVSLILRSIDWQNPGRRFERSFSRLNFLAHSLIDYKKMGHYELFVRLVSESSIPNLISYGNYGQAIDLISLMNVDFLSFSLQKEYPLRFLTQMMEYSLPDNPLIKLAYVIHQTYDRLRKSPNFVGKELLRGYEWLTVHYSRLGDKENLLLAWKEIGKIYFEYVNSHTELLGSNDITKDIHQCIKAARITGDIELEADALHLLGTNYFLTENRVESRTSFERAIKLFDETKRETRVIACLNMLGLVETKEGNYDKAFGSCQTALDMAIKFKSGALVADTANHLGAVFISMGAFSEAVSSLKKARDLWTALNMPSSVAMAEQNLGTALAKITNPPVHFGVDNTQFNISLASSRSPSSSRQIGNYSNVPNQGLVVLRKLLAYEVPFLVAPQISMQVDQPFQLPDGSLRPNPPQVVYKNNLDRSSYINRRYKKNEDLSPGLIIVIVCLLIFLYLILKGSGIL
jgi:tetratricopeptide (TPR) repeat protein